MRAPVSDYAEIGITTNFSFLRGGSDPRAYVHEASRLRIPVIGIADHNTLAGVVRAWKELDSDEVTHPPKLLIGARIVFIDGTPDILVYPRDRAAYGRLCQLLTRGKRVVAEAVIKNDVLQRLLGVDTQSVYDYRQVHFLGGFLAGTASNSAHAANGLTAIFIATGQDVANIPE